MVDPAPRAFPPADFGPNEEWRREIERRLRSGESTTRAQGTAIQGVERSTLSQFATNAALSSRVEDTKTSALEALNATSELELAQEILDQSMTDLDSALEGAQTELEAARGRLDSAEAELDQAFIDIGEAQGAASEAQAKADAAQQAADSKPLMLFGTGAPAGTAPRGSVWFRTNSSGQVIGQWQQTANPSGATWSQREIRSEVIANLDVGKLTAGTAVLNEAVAKKIAAESGQFVELDVSQLNASEANIEQGVIEKLFSDVVVARMAVADEFIGENAILSGSITTEKLTIGEVGENVAPPISEGSSSWRIVNHPGMASTVTFPTVEGSVIAQASVPPYGSAGYNAWSALTVTNAERFHVSDFRDEILVVDTLCRFVAGSTSPTSNPRAVLGLAFFDSSGNVTAVLRGTSLDLRGDFEFFPVADDPDWQAASSFISTASFPAGASWFGPALIFEPTAANSGQFQIAEMGMASSMEGLLLRDGSIIGVKGAFSGVGVTGNVDIGAGLRTGAGAQFGGAIWANGYRGGPVASLSARDGDGESGKVLDILPTPDGSGVTLSPYTAPWGNSSDDPCITFGQSGSQPRPRVGDIDTPWGGISGYHAVHLWAESAVLTPIVKEPGSAFGDDLLNVALRDKWNATSAKVAAARPGWETIGDLHANDHGWTRLSLINDWTAYTSWEPEVMREGNTIWYRGRLGGGTTGTVAATLPTWARPSRDTTVNPLTSSGTGVTEMRIRSNGHLVPFGWVHQEGMISWTVS